VQANPIRALHQWLAPRWRAYAAALVLTLVALGLQFVLASTLQNRPFLIIFLLPVVVSAYLGGLWPGLFATLLSSVITAWFVVPLVQSFSFSTPEHLAHWLFLVLLGVLISVLFSDLAGWRRDTTRRADGRPEPTELKVRLGFAVAIAILGAIGIVSYIAVVRLNENSQLVVRSQTVISSIDSLVTTTFESESAQRAYLITGDEPFAADYTRAIGRVDGHVAQLRDAFRDNPAQLKRVVALAEAVRRKLRRSDELMEVRRSAGLEGVQRRLSMDRGRPGRAMQAAVIRLAQELKSTEIVQLNDHEREARRSALFARWVIVGGSALALLCVGIALFVMRCDFAGRARAEAELNRFAAELRDARDRLEVRVAERTHALEEAYESLRKSERQFRALIENSADCIALTGADRKFRYLSPSVTRIEGYSPDELLGTLASDQTHPDDLEGLAKAMEELSARPGQPIPAVWRRRHKDGHWIWLEGVATNLLDDPSVGAIVCNYRDISERLAHERRVAEQLQRLALLSRITRAIGERQNLGSIFQAVVRTLEDEMPVDFCCVCLYDAVASQLRVVCLGARSEPLARQMRLVVETILPVDDNGLGRSVRGQLVYEPDVDEAKFDFPRRLAGCGLRALVIAPLLVEDQVFGALICARRDAKSFSSGECEFLQQASEHTALAAHQAQLNTDLQQAYDDLRKSQQQVMQQERLRALGQMASGIAHDINNAISPMALYTEALLEHEQSLSERGRKQLEIIQRAVDDVAQTVARMGEFYRFRESEASLAPLDLNQLVEQVLDLTRARWSDMAQQRGSMIDVRLELDAQLPRIAGVQSQLRDALVNLVFNAVDAMPAGGTLTIRTRASKNAQGDTCIIEVADDGIGMDEETRRRCLEPFFSTKGTRGTGLGLAMVYGVVQRHRAQLEIDSEPGKGTVMRIEFAASEIRSEAGKNPDPPPVGPQRILIVDDDPMLLKSLRDVLESDGHEVACAGGGQAGIDACLNAHAAGRPFSVVITDLGMPHVDGRKVAATIKASLPATVVLMLTGWGRRLVADRDIPPGVDGILSKPPRHADLRAALATYLAGSA